MIQIGSGTLQPGKPSALIENLMTKGVLSVSSQVAGAEGANAISGASFDWWTPSAMPATLAVTLAAEDAADCLGVAVHNLGSLGATLIVEKDAGAGWTEAASITPADDSTIMLMFAPAYATAWRVRVTGAVSPSIGVLMLGRRIIFPSGATDDFTPIEWGERIEVLGGETLGGQFLGSRFVRSGGRATINLGRVLRLWFQSKGKVFAHHYNRGRGFFFAEWPNVLSASCAYCWRGEGDSEMTPTLVQKQYVTVSFGVRFYIPYLPDPEIFDDIEVGGGGAGDPDTIGGGTGAGTGGDQGVGGGGATDPDTIGGGGGSTGGAGVGGGGFTDPDTIGGGTGSVGAAPITLSIDSAGPQAGDGSVPLEYTISEDDTVETVLLPAALADPDAGDFNTGLTDPAGYVDLGTVALTTGGSGIALSGPDVPTGSYKLAAMTSTGNIAVSASFTITASADWATTGGDGSITVTAQPSTPAAPETSGGDGTITITG